MTTEELEGSLDRKEIRGFVQHLCPRARACRYLQGGLFEGKQTDATAPAQGKCVMQSVRLLVAVHDSRNQVLAVETGPTIPVFEHLLNEESGGSLSIHS